MAKGDLLNLYMSWYVTVLLLPQTSQQSRGKTTTTRQAGEVEYCDMLYTDWGEPRGVGFVRYKTEQVKGLIAGSMNIWETAIPTHQKLM